MLQHCKNDAASLKILAEHLQENGIENSWRELRSLMAYITGETYESHFFGTLPNLTSSQFDQLKKLVNRRCLQEPLSKITGKREFWGLDFQITKDTLDPRADSETLVQAVLNAFLDRTKPLKIIDFGTGTGCLLISLLKEFPNAFGVAIDQSEAAIQVASKNAIALGVAKRISLCLANWAEPIQSLFDVVISNPPYISIHESLELNVRNYDPILALFAGEDGLEAYRSLFSQIAKLCHQDTKLFFEIGVGQSQAVQEIAANHQFSFVCAHKDLAGIERVLQFETV